MRIKRNYCYIKKSFNLDESSRALCSLNAEPDGVSGVSFSQKPLFFRSINVVMGAVILVPGVLSFSWRIGEHLSWRSPVVSVSVSFKTAAHLSLVISIIVFNIAVFFRDPLSMSNMPILTLTSRVGFYFRLHSSIFLCENVSRGWKRISSYRL